MKITFITDHLLGGGIEKITIDLAELLSKNHTINLIVLDKKNINMDIPKSIKLSVIQFNNEYLKGGIKRNKLKFLSKDKKSELIKIIEDINSDIIIVSHSHSLWLAPILKNSNVWFWIHGNLLGLDFKLNWNPIKLLKSIKNFLKNRNASIYLFKNRNIITVNNDLKNQIKKIIPSANICFISNGVNIEKIEKSVSNIEYKKEWDVIYVGRLSKEKDPLLSIKSFHYSDKAKMAVIGNGDMLDILKKYVNENNLSSKVDFLGWQDNPYEFIKKSKLLILTSRSESFGLVISEALILDVPVLAINVSSGVSYQLSDTQTRRGLINSRDPFLISKKIRELIDMPYKISSDQKEKLSLNNTADQFLSLQKK